MFNRWQQIADLARVWGVLSMIDCAYAVGVVPVNVRQIGCDFYAANCPKWLMGLQGTGFPYVCNTDWTSCARPGRAPDRPRSGRFPS